MGKLISFDNVEYPSLRSLYEAKSVDGLSYSAFINRIKNGYSLDQALNESMKKNDRRKYFVEDMEYSNLKELAESAGISYDSAVKRLHRGWTDYEIFYGKPKKEKVVIENKKNISLVINGQKFKNIQQAYENFKPSCSFNTLRARLRYGWKVEEALEIEAKIDGRKIVSESNVLNINGVNFSLKGASEKFNVPISTISDRLKRGATPMQAVGLIQIEAGQIKKQRETRVKQIRIKKQYVVDGVAFNSISDLAKAYNLPYALVYNRMRDNGWTAEESVKAKASEIVTVNGVQYRSAMSAWSSIGKTTFTTYQSRSQKGYSIGICLGLEQLPSEEKYQIGENFYDSISEVAKAFNLTEGQINARLKSMTLPEAVLYRPSNGRYSPSAFEKNPNLANVSGLLYFVKLKFNSGTLHKIGITQKSTAQRFNAHNFDLIYELKGNLKQLYEIEQLIIKKFSHLHHRADDEFEGKTETFLLIESEEKDILNFILSQENLKQESNLDSNF